MTLFKPTAQQAAIPDSGDLQARYDVTELSLADGNVVSTWADETGNGFDLTTSANPTFQTSVINGNPVIRYDGVDDYHDVSWSGISEPYHLFGVLKLRTTGSFTFYDAESANRSAFITSSGPTYQIYQGTIVGGGTPDTSAHVFSTKFGSTTDVLRVDGTEIASGDAGSGTMDGLSVAMRGSAAQYSPVDAGEILVYPQDKTAVQTDVEQYLSEKWGIAI